MKKILKVVLISYLVLSALFAVVLIATGYSGAASESDIKKTLGSSDIHVIKSVDINNSRVVLFQENEKNEYVQYDRLPAGGSYKLESNEVLDGDDNIVLANGWHAYIVKISKTDITVLSIDKWKGNVTRIVMMFALIFVIAILTVLAAAAVKRCREHA